MALALAQSGTCQIHVVLMRPWWWKPSIKASGVPQLLWLTNGMELVLTIEQQEEKSPHTLAVKDGHCQGPTQYCFCHLREQRQEGKNWGLAQLFQSKGERSGQPHPSSKSVAPWPRRSLRNLPKISIQLPQLCTTWGWELSPPALHQPQVLLSFSEQVCDEIWV